MNRTDRTEQCTIDQAPRGARLRGAAVVVAAILAAIPSTALAANGSDRQTVMIWTTVAIVVTLLLATIGYAYRRVRGMDHPTPDELQMMGGDGHGDDAHADAGHGEAVPPHPEAERGPADAGATGAPAHGAAAGHH